MKQLLFFFATLVFFSASEPKVYGHSNMLFDEVQEIYYPRNKESSPLTFTIRTYIDGEIELEKCIGIGTAQCEKSGGLVVDKEQMRHYRNFVSQIRYSDKERSFTRSCKYPTTSTRNYWVYNWMKILIRSEENPCGAVVYKTSDEAKLMTSAINSLLIRYTRE